MKFVTTLLLLFVLVNLAFAVRKKPSRDDLEHYDDEGNLIADEPTFATKEEEELRQKLQKDVKRFGNVSKQKATALEALSTNLLGQQKYSEVFHIDKEIVLIHEHMDGFEHINTGILFVIL